MAGRRLPFAVAAPPPGARGHHPLRLADRGRRRLGGVVSSPQLEPRGERERVPGGAGGGRPSRSPASSRPVEINTMVPGCPPRLPRRMAVASGCPPSRSRLATPAGRTGSGRCGRRWAPAFGSGRTPTAPGTSKRRSAPLSVLAGLRPRAGGGSRRAPRRHGPAAAPVLRPGRRRDVNQDSRGRIRDAAVERGRRAGHQAAAHRGHRASP